MRASPRRLTGIAAAALAVGAVVWAFTDADGDAPRATEEPEPPASAVEPARASATPTEASAPPADAPATPPIRPARTFAGEPVELLPGQLQTGPSRVEEQEHPVRWAPR